MKNEETNIEIVAGILDAVNNRNYALINEIMAFDFFDNHPGIGEGIKSRNDYLEALKYMHSTLDMKAKVDLSFSKNNKVVTRVTLTGKHIGSFLNFPPTQKEVQWTSIEVYRIENKKIQERWALDDIIGLLLQIGVPITL